MSTYQKCEFHLKVLLKTQQTEDEKLGKWKMISYLCSAEKDNEPEEAAE